MSIYDFTFELIMFGIVFGIFFGPVAISLFAFYMQERRKERARRLSAKD